MVKRPTPIYNVAKSVLFAQRFDHHGLHQERQDYQRFTVQASLHGIKTR